MMDKGNVNGNVQGSKGDLQPLTKCILQWFQMKVVGDESGKGAFFLDKKIRIFVFDLSFLGCYGSII